MSTIPLRPLALLVPAALLFGAPPLAAAQVVFVDADAIGAADGSSWADAFPSLGDALAAADSGDQVWIAEGTYLPPPSATSDPREATFTVVGPIELYGGFAGTESTLAERVPAEHPTTLSGDLGVVGQSSDNSYHVVTASSQVRLDGLIVRDGRAAGHPQFQHLDGGGVFGGAATLTLVGCTFADNVAQRLGGAVDVQFGSGVTAVACTFEDNQAGQRGGALSLRHVSIIELVLCTFADNRATDPTGRGGGADLTNGIPSGQLVVEGCTFTGNEAEQAGGLFIEATSPVRVATCRLVGNEASLDGGGLMLDTSPNAVVVDCQFVDNHAGGSGGGAATIWSKTQFQRCTFAGNSAGAGGGGAASLDTSELTLLIPSADFVGTIFSGNQAAEGGAVLCHGRPDVTLAHCTVALNTATLSGGGVHCEQFLTFGADVDVDNSILWGNSDATGSREGAQIADLDASVKSVDWSIVQGLTGALGGVGNSGANPLLADADGSDNVPGTEDDDLRLAAGSPAIDSADTSALPSDAGDVDCDGDLLEPVPLDRAGLVRVVDDPATPDTGPGRPPQVDRGAYEFASSYAVDIFVEFGGGSPGINGVPALELGGTLCAGQILSLELSDAAPSAFALLWLSLTSTPLNVFGGTVHAFPPTVELSLLTDGSGAFAVTAPWPYGVPPGTDIWFQVIVFDGSVVFGLTLSNAVRGTTP